MDPELIMPAHRYCSLLLLSLVMSLAGCGGGASVTQHQCVAGDWQTLGYRDGANGRRSTTLLAHQNACGEHGIVPDRHGYMLGWEQGAREYCQADNAFVVGERGEHYNNICPEDLRADFLNAYSNGRTLYLARSAVADLERQIGYSQSRLEDVKSEIVAAAAAQFSGTLLPEERLELITRTQRLYSEQQQLEYDLVELERKLVLKEQELNNLNSTLAFAYP
jgi:hypothetical protein